MKLQHLAWTTVPILATAIALVAKFSDLRRPTAALLPSHAVIEYPEGLDLGACAVGQTATARVPVSNRGGAELVMGPFRMSCACSRLEREQEGRLVPVEQLRLAPGEQVELLIRIGIRAPAGGALRNVVVFPTNDPTRPEARIDILIPQITGGVSMTATKAILVTCPAPPAPPPGARSARGTASS